jgi:3',5'-cyclic AMP phosphodiesterase CpdA
MLIGEGHSAGPFKVLKRLPFNIKRTMKLSQEGGSKQGTGPRAKRPMLALLQCMIWLLALVTAMTAAGAPTHSERQKKKPENRPPVRFAILSDLHLFVKQLGTGGEALAKYEAGDPKLLVESEAILDAALEDILKENVKFVIISGDLTKDGELLDHVRVAQKLARLEQHGIQVYVVPGNHDINNSDALRYDGNTTKRVPGTTPELFRAIYERFGYGGPAVDRDSASLSYVVEPVRGLWLLAVDTCKYEESKTLGYPVVSGRIRPETMVWIQKVMTKAHAQGKQVIAFMHHGVNQHFFGEAQLFPDFLLDDWVNASLALAQTGLKVVFTGHYHSQDAAYLVDQNRTPLSPLVDVETGSLVSFPCAFRIATLDAQDQLHIESRYVTAIDFNTGGVKFQDYAYNAIFWPTKEIVTGRIVDMFGVPREQVAAVAQAVTQAIIANYAGDESPSDATMVLIGNLLSSPEPYHTLGAILGGLWTDLPPTPDSDLTVSIDID